MVQGARPRRFVFRESAAPRKRLELPTAPGPPTDCRLARSALAVCLFTFVRHPFDHFVSAYNEAEYRWMKLRRKQEQQREALKKSKERAAQREKEKKRKAEEKEKLRAEAKEEALEEEARRTAGGDASTARALLEHVPFSFGGTVGAAAEPELALSGAGPVSEGLGGPAADAAIDQGRAGAGEGPAADGAGADAGGDGEGGRDAEGSDGQAHDRLVRAQEELKQFLGRHHARSPRDGSETGAAGAPGGEGREGGEAQRGDGGAAVGAAPGAADGAGDGEEDAPRDEKKDPPKPEPRRGHSHAPPMPEGLKGFWTSLPKVDDGMGTEDRALAFLFAVVGMQWMEPPENWLSEKDDVTTGKREIRGPLHKHYISGPVVNGAWCDYPPRLAGSPVRAPPPTRH